VQDALLDKLRAAVGAANVLTGIELSPYVVEGRTPEAAVFPGSIEEVAAVMVMASEVRRPVTPWGGGTGASVGMRPCPRRAPGSSWAFAGSAGSWITSPAI